MPKNKTRRAWTKIKETVLVHGQKIGAFLISNFRRVLNVICFLLGDSDAGESPKRKHTTNTEACVDLRLTAVGMHETEQH